MKAVLTPLYSGFRLLNPVFWFLTPALKKAQPGGFPALWTALAV
jgi:hypothetical protein